MSGFTNKFKDHNSTREQEVKICLKTPNMIRYGLGEIPKILLNCTPGEAGCDADNESDGFSDIEAPTADSETTATTTTPPRQSLQHTMAEEKQVGMSMAPRSG